jgi:predicted ATPase
MSNGLVKIEIQNYRSIANLKLELGSLNVLFGPNGVGKSTFLDAVLFLSQSLNRGVREIAAEHGQGLGLLWDRADEKDKVIIDLMTSSASYKLSFGFAQGRFDNFTESLVDKKGLELIKRDSGVSRVIFYDKDANEAKGMNLITDALNLLRYVDSYPSTNEAVEMKEVLESVSFHLARTDNIERLKRLGSESSHHLTLSYQSENLWSVLRNLKDRSVLDSRYETIMRFMQDSFPSFKNLLFEQTGMNSLYASMIEEGKRKPIPASGMADGYIQMLINLTALFSEEKGKTFLILFDEPDTSLHPHAIAQFAEAVKLATEEWGRQVFIATHSPVLLSQFSAENIFAVGFDENRATVMQRVSEIENIKDLLEEYALGSLYMAEAIAPQSKPFVEV